MSALPFSLRAQVFFRTFFIQAGFSPGSLQALGLLYALKPALEFLYRDEAKLNEAIERHMAPFNTHPYVATGIVGGILFHEEKVSRGESSADSVNQFKSRLSGPLAALGDGFFWLSLRPAVGALCAALTPFVSLWAPLIFMVLYNMVHVASRLWLFHLCHSTGEGVVLVLSKAKIPSWSRRLRWLAIACAGVLGGVLTFRFGAHGNNPVPSMVASTSSAMMAMWLFKRHRVRPIYLVYAVAALAIIAGAFV